MGARPITARGWAMLEQLPAVLRDSHDIQSIVHVLSREFDYADGLLAQLRAQLNPATADIAISGWERTLKLAGDGTTGQRQAAVVAALRALLTSGEGKDWVARVSAQIGPGWSYAEHDPADPASPPAATLKITLPFSLAGARFTAVQALIEDETPAHLALEWASTTGFVWDESSWDGSAWGV